MLSAPFHRSLFIGHDSILLIYTPQQETISYNLLLTISTTMLPLFPAIIALSSLLSLIIATSIPSPTQHITDLFDTNAPAPTGIADAITTQRRLINQQGAETSVVDNNGTPISICGYFDRVIDNVHFNQPYACKQNKWCGADDEDKWFGCCLGSMIDDHGILRPDQCAIRTKCVPQAAMSGCDDNCQSDTEVLKW